MRWAFSTLSNGNWWRPTFDSLRQNIFTGRDPGLAALKVVPGAPCLQLANCPGIVVVYKRRMSMYYVIIPAHALVS